ncbi:MAG TPA: shikimate kinase [Chlamydiales bacterium]|nr:shikimate kinase [Chlamydiales bacterium]
MKIAIIGFKHSGKTTFLKKLQQERMYKSIDLDEEIEKTFEKLYLEKKKCFEIVRDKGILFFRKLEKKVLLGLDSHQILATGGGTILDEENVFLLKRSYKILWLDTPFSVIEKRISNNFESIFSDEKMDLKKLYEKRMPIYAKLADLRFSYEMPLKEIMDWIEEVQ